MCTQDCDREADASIWLWDWDRGCRRNRGRKRQQAGRWDRRGVLRERCWGVKGVPEEEGLENNMGACGRSELVIVVSSMNKRLCERYGPSSIHNYF